MTDLINKVNNTPEELIRWADDEFGPDVALACSFGGLTGMVLVDMAVKVGSHAEVFYLDTEVLFPETRELVKEVERRYGIKPVAYKSQLTLDQQAERYGPELWRRDPDLCCQLRKVEPNVRALAGKKAWITGIRRDQGSSRQTVELVDWDAKFQLMKLNPLALWTEAQVRAYIEEHDVPYNPLLDRGYPSLGCMPCTRAVDSSEYTRDGRWPGFNKNECGLHYSAPSVPVSAIGIQNRTANPDGEALQPA